MRPVLTARQMGKSSLMVRTANRLREEGVNVAVLDLTAVGQNLTLVQWYRGLALRIGQQLELEEEKRRHAETIKILRKKERTVKEVMIQCEEDQKNISLLQEALECANSKVGLYKRQLNEQVKFYQTKFLDISTNKSFLG